MYNRDDIKYTVLMKDYEYEKRIFNIRVDDTKVYFYKVFFQHYNVDDHAVWKK